MAQQVLDGAQLEAGVRQQHRRRTLGPAKGDGQASDLVQPTLRSQGHLAASPAGGPSTPGSVEWGENMLKCSQRVATRLLFCHPHPAQRLRGSIRCISAC